MNDNKYRVLLILMLFCLAVNGCSGVVGKHFTFRDSVVIESRLRLDGYYYRIENSGSSTGTTIVSILLWNDGAAAYLGPYGEVQDDPEVRPIRYGTLEEAHEALQRLLKDPELFVRSKNRAIRWGAFRVQSDSIAIQVFRARPGSIPAVHDVMEYRGRVLSDTSFVLDDVKAYSGPYDDDPRRLSETYYFHPLEEKPPSTNWTQTHPELR